MADAKAYKPKDTLPLWWLGGGEAEATPIGLLSLAEGNRKVGLQYSEAWLTSGFALSEDLPLVSQLFLPREKDQAAGAVDDARPDRWGERVIRKFEQTQRLSVLEYLLFAGDDRSGALGVSQSEEAYVPWPSDPAPDLGSLDEMAEVVRKVLADEPVPEIQKRLLRPGASLGGARPKSLITIDGAPWLVKFSEGEDMDTELIEHASMTLAASCGIEVASTRALQAGGRHAVAIRRFDRAGGMRLHAISANVALRAAGEELGYPQLAQLLRRLAPARQIASQQAQLFRRMVFNILIDNTDDHEKNHALLRQPDGSYLLAPAFDVLPAAQGLGYQALGVGAAGSESTIENALSRSQDFGLKPAAAREIAGQVASVTDRWKDHFVQAGVRKADMAILSQYLDGNRLGDQRREHAGGSRSNGKEAWPKGPG